MMKMKNNKNQFKYYQYPKESKKFNNKKHYNYKYNMKKFRM